MPLRFILLACFGLVLLGQTPDRWTLEADGGIRWVVAAGDAAHRDQMEMSGLRVSLIVDYGVDGQGQLLLKRQIVFPLLRTIPNDTHASLIYPFGEDASPRILVNGQWARTESPREFRLRGMLVVTSRAGRKGELSVTRTIFPSTTKQAVIERIALTNLSAAPVAVEVEPTAKVARTNPARGVYGGYSITSKMLDATERALKPNETTVFTQVFVGKKDAEADPVIDGAAEEAARKELIDGYLSKLVLETPDPVLNRLFAFAKIRTAESVYQTKGGLMHGPGGGSYYAAIWANDQAEYANPFFPFLGDGTANASAINAFRLFAGYMNPEYKPIPSSIIAEGSGFWNGAGDRGDMAMIAYGAGRFALSFGDKKTAEQLWPLIEWCLEYCRRKVNERGVVTSDSDELEGRFPAGKANLNTSSLYYDALRSAIYLGRDLGKPVKQLKTYETQAAAMKKAIDGYFGATIDGFDTYRYYEGNTALRAWICTPLAMGIFERAKGTTDALFSPKLWTVDGLASQAGEKTFWDRATLYALRGVIGAGDTQRALPFLEAYSRRRLLGEHVPYPVEAWPEGNQRHLAAESALYARIYTEGLFGIRPTGLKQFTLTPQLPSTWSEMSLRHVRAFDSDFDLTVKRSGDRIEVAFTEGGKTKTVLLKPGETMSVGNPVEEAKPVRKKK